MDMKQCTRVGGCQHHVLFSAVQVNINASCSFAKDVLRGDDVSEMHLKLLSQKSEVYPYTEDD